MLIDDLIEIGLSQNEAKIYLALLELGPTTTGPLIKKTCLYRVITYDTLEKLLKLGLVNYSLKKNIKNFEAEDPKQLMELIKNKEFTKPLAVFVRGKFANMFSEGMNTGHAGAIVGRGQSAEDKEKALREVGVMTADKYEDLVGLVRPFSE